MLPYIIGGEVLFWALLIVGLSTRYLLDWRGASTALLIATPIIDIVIIALTYVDLAEGSSSDFSHGLAAFYVGFSTVFGPDVVRFLDRKLARRFSERHKDEPTHAGDRSALIDWYRCLLASAITGALLGVGIFVAGWTDSFWLLYWLIVVVFTAAAWAVLGPVRESRRNRRAYSSGDKSGRSGAASDDP